MSDFPSNFIWATATAAYQIECGGTKGGRGLSIWDDIRAEKGRIEDASDSTQTVGGFEKWKEDIQLVKQLGVSHYRISICWSRILPNGIGQVNTEGIKHYRNLLEEMLANGIEPIVTLFHADWPLVLFDRGGWLNPSSIEWYTEFCQLCFENYSDIVKYWITFNEIPMHAWCGATKFNGEPNHCPTRPPPKEGHNTPYIVAHNMLLAHSKVYHLYKSKYNQNGQGQMGIVAGGMWCEGTNKDATERALDTLFNWTISPIFGSTGDYPKTMRDRLNGEGNLPLLPRFTDEQRDEIKGSADFLGLNFYTPHLISEGLGSTLREQHGNYKAIEDNWERISGPTSWLRYRPQALTEILCYIKDNYNNVPVLITENGCPDLPENDPAGKNPLDDQHRIRYLKGHVEAVRDALKRGCNVIGYTAWSLLDNFEWSDGFAVRFGLYRVDYDSPDKTRTAKKSVDFYKRIIQENRYKNEDL